MRKINKDELKKTSAAFAEIFCDYTPYRLLFDEKRLAKGRELLFRCEVFCALDYTYVDENFEVIASVKRPGDKDRDLALLLADPRFMFEAMKLSDAHSRALLKEYVSFAQGFADKYYNPETDCYIKNIGVASSARGKGLLRKAIDELCGDMPVYLETHTQENVALYKHLGFELLESAPFHGYTHYCMKRPALKKTETVRKVL